MAHIVGVDDVGGVVDVVVSIGYVDGVGDAGCVVIYAVDVDGVVSAVDGVVGDDDVTEVAGGL